MGVSLVTLFMLAISGGAVFLDRHVLERMAYYDPLTDLPNRHGLVRYFKDEFFGSRSGAVFLWIWIGLSRLMIRLDMI